MKRRKRSILDAGEEPEFTPYDVELKAVSLLARREHSRQELHFKLTGRGFPAELVSEVLDDLAARNLQSDERFAESYIRSRVERGFGPLKIRAELNERGVDGWLAGEALNTFAGEWDELAQAAREKRFGGLPADEPRERARQTRFLQQRGFHHDQIRQALATIR